MGELVSSYDDGGQLTVSYTAREIQSCVYPTVLCLLRMSFCFNKKKLPKGLMSLEPLAFQIDVISAEKVSFKSNLSH